MPNRIKFSPFVPTEERAALSLALVPLADAGYAVRVEFPDVERHRGWQIILDKPGKHLSIRIARDATAPEWSEFMANL